MRREFFMDGETLMVSMKADASTVVTRPATDEEEFDFNALKKYEGKVDLDIDATDKPKPKKSKK